MADGETNGRFHTDSISSLILTNQRTRRVCMRLREKRQMLLVCNVFPEYGKYLDEKTKTIVEWRGGGNEKRDSPVDRSNLLRG